MKRNSTTVFIESNGSITPLPWLGVEPNFSRVEEPTLSILKKAWEVDKNNAEVISDPDPVPELVIPNWGDFNRDAFLSPVVQNIFSLTSNSSAVIDLKIVLAPLGYVPNGLAESDYQLVKVIWDAIINGLSASLTIEDISSINLIASNSSMKFAFGTDGKMLLI
jgi:hypothetical protein